MRPAANVVAVLAWGGFLAALWAPLVTGQLPPVGIWIAATAASFIVGMVVPAFLLGVEGRT